MKPYDESSQAVAIQEDLHPERDLELVVEQSFDPGLWKRLEFNHIPIYIRADKPEWFVPNTAGDEILKKWARQGEIDRAVGTLQFLNRLPRSPLRRYAGRDQYLQTDALHEVWFRLTTKCNKLCSRCQFQPKMEREETLPAKKIFTLADEAVAEGCRLFVLTGGEPFMHPQFDSIVEELLKHDSVHVAILTNGSLLREHARAMKDWPRDRLHFQVSAEGGESKFNPLRGDADFREWQENIRWLKAQNFHFSLSMCVTSDSMDAMADFIDLAAMVEAPSVHFMWYFIGGEGNVFDLATADEIFDHLLPAWEKAKTRHVVIDNVLLIQRQIFSPAGTICDGTVAGWESVTLGADGKMYPSVSLGGFRELGTDIGDDLGRAWRTSPVMNRLRKSTVAPFSSCMLLLLGGGDSDHSYLRSGEFAGFDPYWGLYEKIALKLISEKAAEEPEAGPPRLRLKMGDVIDFGVPKREVSLRPTKNLFALVGDKGVGLVNEYYGRSDDEDEEMTFNTVTLPDEWVRHIPLECRIRSYGFGSPIHDTDIHEGQRIVEIGSDLGVECFIAARQVGSSGFVIGIESRDDIRNLAELGGNKVAENLGYRNYEFRKGMPEAVPVENESADVVISNCVLNLSKNKRRAIREMFRILRQDGRLVVSDLVCENEPVTRREAKNLVCSSCLAGALTLRDLFGLLEEAGFTSPKVLKWLPYRVVGSHTFFRIVFQAVKVQVDDKINVMYRGPFASVVTHRGTILMPGVIQRISADEIAGMRDDVLILDEHGTVLTDSV
jgi:MoaA/NifB/PqqE/SkfB family radical SAM enzyme/SAM-dependent methyltransferase